MCSLHTLRDFTVEINDTILKPLEEGNYEGLVSIMRSLFKVRERQGEYDSLFELLADILHFLKVYDVEIPADVFILMHV